MTAYTIENNIPIPPSKGGRGGIQNSPRSELHQALASLQPRQSILLETPDEFQRVKSLWHRLPANSMTSRKTREGWRIWRIA